MEGEINYAELFGVATGENERDNAEPAAEVQAEAQGGNEQEAAQIADAAQKQPLTASPAPQVQATQDEVVLPFSNQSECFDLKGTSPEADTPAGLPDGTERKERGRGQSPEENARFAAARRKAEAERDAAIAEAERRAKEQAEAFIASVLADSGILDPYTGKPVTTTEEYEAYRRHRAEAQKSTVIDATGMSDEEYQQFVESLPQVREARAAQAEAEKIRKQAAELQARVRLEKQLKEIGQLDPSIKSVDDLVYMDNYPEFYERVQRGMTMTEAFKLTNYDRLTRDAMKASRQAAMNETAGKQHMAQTQQRGEEAVSVPADVREMYKAINPDATDAEIQAHWRRSQK